MHAKRGGSLAFLFVFCSWALVIRRGDSEEEGRSKKIWAGAFFSTDNTGLDSIENDREFQRHGIFFKVIVLLYTSLPTAVIQRSKKYSSVFFVVAHMWQLCLGPKGSSFNEHLPPLFFVWSQRTKPICIKLKPLCLYLSLSWRAREL